MHTHRQKLKAGLAATGALVVMALAAPAGASAVPGGCGGGGLTPATADICTPTAKARLLPNGMVIPPQSAPGRVKAVIRAANRIRSKPYIWGGGHGRWWDRGYDCSGAVSYALHGGGFIDSPLPSGPMASGWGEAGEGRWITVYANGGHAYAVIAGIRWDTSGNTDNRTGPSWHEDLRTNAGFIARHPLGF
ncbi:MAG TPA: hypothetical protein VF176_10440 [Solirubrobacterales bacterium]